MFSRNRKGDAVVGAERRKGNLVVDQFGEVMKSQGGLSVSSLLGR